jgi:chemosensory pili system protein ChpA (sensor histidine kinase/response regulator)
VEDWAAELASPEELVPEAEEAVAEEPEKEEKPAEEPLSEEQVEAVQAEAELEEDLAAAPIELESELYEIFRSESESHLATIEKFIAHCRSEDHCEVSDELIRAVHTLRGSAHMADINSMAQLAEAMEEYCNTAATDGDETEDETVDLLSRFRTVMEDILVAINVTGAS